MKNQLMTFVKKFQPLVFIFIALLAGCSSRIEVLKPLSVNTPLDENKGIVVVRVINASSYPFHFNSVMISPKNLNESEKVKLKELESTFDTTTNSSIFSSQLEAGSYSVTGIYSFHSNGEFWYSRSARTDVKFGTFEIEAGKTTDLGTIIYYPKPQEDLYLNTLLRVPELSPAQVLNTYFPFINKVEPEQVLQWNEDDYQEERNTLFNFVLQNPVTYNKAYLSPDGSVYFIGKLGFILKRDLEKEWHIDAVDTN